MVKYWNIIKPSGHTDSDIKTANLDKKLAEVPFYFFPENLRRSR